MGPLYQLGSTDQRHRSTVNAIWDMGKGFQLSGLYFFGSGERRGTNWGADLRNTGGANYGILTPAGTTAASLGTVCGCNVKGQTLADGSFLVDRAQFVGSPIHRVDLSLRKKFGLGGRRQLEGIAEVFNVFNHENYGSYTTTFSSGANFGKPSFNSSTAYQARSLQLGVHFTF
jgi:hypothetical protein